MKFTLNAKGLKKFQQDLNDAYADTIAQLEVKCEEVIRDPSAFAQEGFLDQDIVDTGRFADSQQVNVRDGVATFVWNPHDPETGYPYAPALYSGFLAWGKKYIPGRKWFEKACDQLDVSETLRQNMVSRGVRAKVKLKRKVDS